MPNAPDRMQLTTEEMREFPITGPFGGIQTELPLDQIENYGFATIDNFMLRKGAASLRPGFTVLPAFSAPANEYILGFADFFNASGVRQQVAFTQTRLFKWNAGPQTWTQITGTAFTGSTSQPFSWDVVANKLCWSQGADQIYIWDGIAGAYTLASVMAPAANYVAEIGLHLMTLNTIEAATSFTQRYHWSGIGDPTDWTSFSSGINDNLNNLGPGYGLKKLGQYGYGWHVWGILQIQPTGSGVLPFIFTPIANSSIGNFCRHSLDHFNQNGVECAAYCGWDNVYIFNQSSVIPIGDQPIDGRKRLGARSSITQDILSGGPDNVFGYVTQNVKGNIYNAYWIIIPGVSTWAYNFDEGNWTRFTFTNQQTVMGKFLNQTQIRIIDLVGTIAQQNWVIGSLNSTNSYDGLALGFNNGNIGYVDFSVPCERSGSIASGIHLFNDRRHKKSVKKFRLVVQDRGPVAYTVTLTNNTGQSQTQTVTIGTGSGDSISYVFSFSITGLRIQWNVSVPSSTLASIVEFAPMYDISGEQRGGTID